MGLADTAELAVRINLSGNASTGIDKLQRKVNGLGTSVGRVGKGFGQIGAGLGRAGLLVGGAVAVGIGAAAKAAIDFEDAFAGVKKTVDEANLVKAGLSFETLAKTFRTMSTEIPISAVAFAQLGETAGALGVAAGDIDDFVAVTAKLGVTTDLTADAAADALGRIGTILKFTGKDYENFADSLVALGNAGASTESEIIEISKRFAAEGKAAGLAKEDIAGLASATASLGFAPERGGTALARVFANMATNIALANKKGKAFSSTTGRSIKDLQSSLDRGDGMGIFLDVLKSIKGLSPTQAARTLKALGVTNTSDRTIFRTMSDNLPFVNDQLKIAANATGALSTEATKKFDTIRSKLTVLKNNFIEAGITIGEGFLPALGRATDKLIAFLKVDTNKSALKAIGEDIGKAIDGIKWDEVLKGARDFVGVMKGALTFAVMIAKALNTLPTEVKAAAAGLLLLNKASGGLIAAGVGNVAGGIAETAIRGIGSKLPGVGSLFAQPVFVTNFPLGFGGGGVPGGLPGGAAAGAGVGGLTAGGIAAGAGALVVTAASAAVIGTAIAGAMYGEENQRLKDRGLTPAEVAAVKYYAADQASQQTIVKRLGYVPDKADAGAGNAKLVPVIREMPLSFARSSALTTAAAQETKRETTRGATLMAATARTGSAAIVGAIYANRPDIDVVVNVSGTTVSKTITKSTRYGPNLGSRNRDALGSSPRSGPLV